MPQIYDMGPTALLPLRRKACWGFFRPKNPTASAGFEPAYMYIYIYIMVKVKWSRYRPGVAQRLGRGIVLLFYDRGTRRGWVVSSRPRPHFTPGKEPVPILQKAGWALGPIWKGGKSCSHRDSILNPPALISPYSDWATRSIYIST